VNCIRNYAFGSHACVWLALAMVILLSVAFRIVSLRFWLWLVTRKRNRDDNEDESAKDYRRIHGG